MKLRHSCKLLLIERERVNMILALVLPTKSWRYSIRKVYQVLPLFPVLPICKDPEVRRARLKGEGRSCSTIRERDFPDKGREGPGGTFPRHEGKGKLLFIREVKEEFEPYYLVPDPNLEETNRSGNYSPPNEIISKLFI